MNVHSFPLPLLMALKRAGIFWFLAAFSSWKWIDLSNFPLHLPNSAFAFLVPQFIQAIWRLHRIRNLLLMASKKTETKLSGRGGFSLDVSTQRSSAAMKLHAQDIPERDWRVNLKAYCSWEERLQGILFFFLPQRLEASSTLSTPNERGINCHSPKGRLEEDASSSIYALCGMLRVERRKRESEIKVAKSCGSGLWLFSVQYYSSLRFVFLGSERKKRKVEACRLWIFLG